MPNSSLKLVAYQVLRHSDGGVKIVVNGPMLDRMNVSVKVAEEDVPHVVSLVVMMVLDIVLACLGVGSISDGDGRC